ncbi:MAG: cytochrome c3 family protein [Anaerolineae bacterium]
MRKSQLLVTVGVLLVIAGMSLLLQSQVVAQEATPAPTPEPYTGFGAPLEGDAPYLAAIYNAWAGSGHADTEAEAFNHWNSEGAVPESCARCHSTPGYIDFVGGDGSTPFKVDAPAPLGTVLTCDGCHNSAASQLTSVTFPSGATIENVGRSARCMQCHQGRASTDSVNAAIEKAGLTSDNDNTVSTDLGFINIHYFAAAATLYGGEARGGYQFEGKFYQGRNMHAEGLNTCADCHNPHTLEVKVDVCADCHEDVQSVEDLPYIRMNGSGADYDGDGDTLEGISEEIQGLQELAMEALQSYAREVSGTPIAYSAESYPYFFVDTNDNGEVDEDEATSANGYKAFTPTLLKAAYNYQVSVKDPGGFAHNPKYIIELLYDSIDALNTQMTEPVDLSTASRDDIGHFAVTTEPFRHWDAEGEVPAGCTRCHTPGGLPFYIENGVNIKGPVPQSLACSTCHEVENDFEVYKVDQVTFPSGAKVSFGEGDENNLCITCHQGRESTVSVNNAIKGAGVGPDEVSPKLAFRNVHYFAAGATLFGTEVKGAYEFDGNEYNGRNMHVEEAQVCTDCHVTHTGAVKVDECADCHDGVETQEDLRAMIRNEQEDVDPIDYDGDGDTAEPIAAEIQSFQEALLAAMQAYATDKGTSIAYSPAAYPYFFIDTNGNGVADADEANNDNRYVSWTPNLLGAAYNYQYSNKDPGAFAHNPDYILQVLYDSIKAVGGDVASFTRPPVVPPATS